MKEENNKEQSILLGKNDSRSDHFLGMGAALLKAINLYTMTNRG